MESIMNFTIKHFFSRFGKMNLIFFATFCILSPEISSARTYLIVDEDALRNLQLNSHIARRNTENGNNFVLSKDFIKTALNFLQSYDENDLNNAFEYFKNQLAGVNVEDQTLNIAKDFVLEKLYRMKGKPGKEIKNLINVLSQKLDDGNIMMRTTDEDGVGEIVSKFWEETKAQRSRDDRSFTIVDAINTAINAFAGMLNAPSGKLGRSHKGEAGDLFLQLLNLFKDYQEKGSFDENDLAKLTKVYEEYKGNKNPGNPSKIGHPIGHFSKLFHERDRNEGADWGSLISKFMADMENNHSIDWLQQIMTAVMHNDNVFKQLEQYKHTKKWTR